MAHPSVDETGEVVPSGKNMEVSQTETWMGQSRKKTRIGKGDITRHEVN